MTEETSAARKARMASKGGWQMSGSVATDPRHTELLPSNTRNRSRCHCGCGGKCSHGGFANGLIMASGCEWSMRVWVRDGYRVSGGADLGV